MTPSDHMSAWNGLYPWLDGSQLITCATMYYEVAAHHTLRCRRWLRDGCGCNNVTNALWPLASGVVDHLGRHVRLRAAARVPRVVLRRRAREHLRDSTPLAKSCG